MKAILTLCLPSIVLVPLWPEPGGEQIRAHYAAEALWQTETHATFKLGFTSREVGPETAPEHVEIPEGRYVEEIYDVAATGRVTGVEAGRVTGLECSVDNARFRYVNATRPMPEGSSGRSPVHGLRIELLKTGEEYVRRRVLEGEPPMGMGWLEGVQLESGFDVFLPPADLGAEWGALEVGASWGVEPNSALVLGHLEWLGSLYDTGGPGRAGDKNRILRLPHFTVGRVLRTLILRGSWTVEARLTGLDTDEARIEVKALGTGILSRGPIGTEAGEKASKQFVQVQQGQKLLGPAVSEVAGQIISELTFDRALGRFVSLKTTGLLTRTNTSRRELNGVPQVDRVVTTIDLELEWSGGLAE